MFQPALTNKKKAAALILTLIILSAILIIGSASVKHIIKNIQLSRTISYSAPAYYAAESGIECMLYQISEAGQEAEEAEKTCNDRSPLGQAAYEIDVNGKYITSLGTYQKANRAIQVYVP